MTRRPLATEHAPTPANLLYALMCLLARRGDAAELLRREDKQTELKGLS